MKTKTNDQYNLIAQLYIYNSQYATVALLLLSIAWYEISVSPRGTWLPLKNPRSIRRFTHSKFNVQKELKE